MSLWLAVTSHSERLDHTKASIEWVGIGFGWWRFTARNGSTKIRDVIRSDFDTGRMLARDACEVAVGEVA